MNRQRVTVGAVSFLLGVVIVISVIYRVWRPTVTNPSFWENNTGGLTSLVLQTVLAGGLVVAGIAIVFDDAMGRFPLVTAQIAGAAGIVGGLFGYGPIARGVTDVTSTGSVVSSGIEAVTYVLLVVAVAGVVVRYPPSDRWGRYGAGVVAGGFLTLVGETLLGWALASVDPRAGALSYPPLGLEFVGTLALAVGSVLLGWSLLARDDASNWLGSFVLVAGLLAIPIGILAHLQTPIASGGYDLAWVVVGSHLLLSDSNQPR